MTEDYTNPWLVGQPCPACCVLVTDGAKHACGGLRAGWEAAKTLHQLRLAAQDRFFPGIVDMDAFRRWMAR